VIYGHEALRRLREQQAKPPEPEQRSLLAQMPSGAPMDDATLTVWNGERWVAYDRWRATAPVIREDKPEVAGPAAPKEPTCVAGECDCTKVWLVRGGERWQMFVGSIKAGGRRRDFATPCLEHAIRTAEFWYGAPCGRWRVEKGRDGNCREAADLPAQDSTVEEGTGERGHDELDLGG
jgi:hypothetical protein